VGDDNAPGSPGAVDTPGVKARTAAREQSNRACHRGVRDSGRAPELPWWAPSGPTSRTPPAAPAPATCHRGDRVPVSRAPGAALAQPGSTARPWREV